MNSYRKIFFIFFLLTLCFHHVYAQKKDENPVRKFSTIERPFFTGGNFGLQFGSVTAIDVSPILGYRLTENIAVGIGATYQYFKDARYPPSISIDIYGGRLFARYYFFEMFFLHGEYELINYEKLNIISGSSTINKERIWENNLFLGAGYRQLLGEFSSMHASLLWNFNQGPYSPYSNPQLRIGFDIQL